MPDQIETETLLKVRDLNVRFKVKRSSSWRKPTYLHAVDSISFDARAGETLAIVGESGSGKSTTALAVARLVAGKTSGSVALEGKEVLMLDDAEMRNMREKMQFIFQDPYSSLNPRLRANDIVREPLDSITDKSKSEKDEIVSDLFKAVGLRPEQQRLFAHQFSGGQRQRLGIARALSTKPKLVICDEPVSGLDVAVQAQILNLLKKLQTKLGLTYLFISHDLGVVQHVSDSVAVMYMGKIVEYADRMSLFSNPLHPYTAALLSAVPSVDRGHRENTRRILIPGDPPDPVNLPKGCRFASRCPVAADICRQSDPDLATVANNHKVACHLVNENAKSPLNN